MNVCMLRIGRCCWIAAACAVEHTVRPPSDWQRCLSLEGGAVLAVNAAMLIKMVQRSKRPQVQPSRQSFSTCSLVDGSAGSIKSAKFVACLRSSLSRVEPLTLTTSQHGCLRVCQACHSHCDTEWLGSVRDQPRKPYAAAYVLQSEQLHLSSAKCNPILKPRPSWLSLLPASVETAMHLFCAVVGLQCTDSSPQALLVCARHMRQPPTAYIPAVQAFWTGLWALVVLELSGSQT